MKECKTCLKTREFFFWCFVYCSETNLTTMMAMSLAVMDTGARGALLLRHCSLAFAFVTLGEWKRVDVSECFCFFPHKKL